MLSDYLRPGADRARLLDAMSDGHGRAKHGAELGTPSIDAYRARVAGHLDHAPHAFAVTRVGQSTRYLVIDAARNTVAWINPTRLDRSTLFEPRRGVPAYVRSLRASRVPERLQTIDVGVARSATRAPASRITSAARSAARGGAERG